MRGPDQIAWWAGGALPIDVIPDDRYLPAGHDRVAAAGPNGPLADDDLRRDRVIAAGAARVPVGIPDDRRGEGQPAVVRPDEPDGIGVEVAGADDRVGLRPGVVGRPR